MYYIIYILNVSKILHLPGVDPTKARSKIHIYAMKDK